MFTLTLRTLQAGDRDKAIQLARETEVFRPAELTVLAEVIDDYLQASPPEAYHALVMELRDFRDATPDNREEKDDEHEFSTFLLESRPSSSIAPSVPMTVHLVGFVIYGPTPLTVHTWDVYWLVVGKAYQRHGIGSRLLQAAEARIRAHRGEVIRLETSSLPAYEPTRRFYQKHGYQLAGIIPDFYARGDSLCIYYKSLAE